MTTGRRYVTEQEIGNPSIPNDEQLAPVKQYFFPSTLNSKFGKSVLLFSYISVSTEVLGVPSLHRPSYRGVYSVWYLLPVACLEFNFSFLSVPPCFFLSHFCPVSRSATVITSTWPAWGFFPLFRCKTAVSVFNCHRAITRNSSSSI